MGSMHTGLEEAGDLSEMAGDGHISLFAQPNVLTFEMSEFYAERARGGVGLIVTGGIAPNVVGAVMAGASKMTNEREAEAHKRITRAVHDNGGKIGQPNKSCLTTSL